MYILKDESNQKVPRVFISYSRGTNAEYLFAKQLIARIAAQPLDPWDFEVLDDQIKTGNRIDQACIDQIDRADVFMVLITDAALKSDYVSVEVAYALERANNGRDKIYIFPISLTEIPNWNPPFDQLRLLKNASVSIQNLKGNPRSEIVEEIIFDLCCALDVDYIAPDQDAPCLPLRRNLMIEIDGLRGLNSQTRKLIRFGEILHICSLLITDLTQNNYQKSLINIIHLEEKLRSREYFPDHQFYYISIVKAVIYYNLAAEDVKNLSKAQRIFQDLIDKNHPLLDVNAYAGVGNVAMIRADFNCALENHRKALQLCPHSAACFHNLLLSKLALRQSLDPSEIYEKTKSIESGLASQSPGSINRMAILLIFALVHIRDFYRAIKLRRLLRNVDQDQGDLILWIIKTLFEQAEIDDDVEIMENAEYFSESFIEQLENIPSKTIAKLYNYIAWVKNYLGKGEEAIDFFQLALDISPNNIRYRVDMAMQELDRGNNSGAEELLEFVINLDIDLATEDMPIKEYHYYLGSAYWLISKNEIADFNYTMSQGYGKHYSQINNWIERISRKNH